MLLRYLLESRAGKEAVVMKLKSLESSVSTGRKCKYLSLKVQCFQGLHFHSPKPTMQLAVVLLGIQKRLNTLLWAVLRCLPLVTFDAIP